MPQDYLYGGVCHPVDLLRWILGEVDEVFAYGSHGKIDPRYPADKENNFIISLKYQSGVIARVLGGFDLDPSARALAAGPFTAWASASMARKRRSSTTASSMTITARASRRKSRSQPRDEKEDHAGETIGFLRHFEDCLVKDEQPLVDVRDGAQIVAICSACWDSIHSGLPVKVTREFGK